MKLRCLTPMIFFFWDSSFCVCQFLVNIINACLPIYRYQKKKNVYKKIFYTLGKVKIGPVASHSKDNIDFL